MSHHDDAEAMLDALRTIAEAIPGFGLGTKRELGSLVRYASVPDGCIVNTLGVVADRPRLAAAVDLDIDAAYDAIEFTAAYKRVARKLELMAGAVRVAILRRRAPVGQAVLLALAVAKRMKYDVKASRRALAKKQRRFPAAGRRKG
ncbi:MAG TPA: hypothetical protein VGF28_17240 [Thermoanaerobaculia bacterium]|jgi:hypothetical protein